MVTVKVFSKIGITYFVEKNNIISASSLDSATCCAGLVIRLKLCRCKNLHNFFYKKVLTNYLDNAIIQSQVEGNRTRAGEGRD